MKHYLRVDTRAKCLLIDNKSPGHVSGNKIMSLGEN